MKALLIIIAAMEGILVLAALLPDSTRSRQAERAAVEWQKSPTEANKAELHAWAEKITRARNQHNTIVWSFLAANTVALLLVARRHRSIQRPTP